MLQEPNFMPYGYGHARFLSSRLNSNSSPRSGIYLNHAKSEVKDHSTKVGARFHNIIVRQSLQAYPIYGGKHSL